MSNKSLLEETLSRIRQLSDVEFNQITEEIIKESSKRKNTTNITSENNHKEILDSNHRSPDWFNWTR